MDEKQLLVYVLTKQFNKTDDEVAELIYNSDGTLKEDAGDVILHVNAEKVAKMKKDATTKFDDGYKKAQKEVMERAEKIFKEKTGFTEDAADFESLLDGFLKAKPTTKLTDDDVKKHPAFLALENSRVPKSDYESLKAEYDNFRVSAQREKIIQKIQDKAWALTEARNPVLSDNPIVAKTRRDDFLRKFSDFDYEFVGDEVVVLKEGKRIEDSQGNHKTFNSLVDELAQTSFDFKKQDGKDTPKTPPRFGAVKMTSEEYYQRLSQEKDPQKRIELQNAYRNQ